MMDPPIPNDEASRLSVLESCQVLDTDPEDSFQDMARIAGEVCEAPVALVSLVASDRQWFKARVGFTGKETPRRISFCAHALTAREPLVVRDTTSDERFAGNPLVSSAPHFRFYAGVPLHVDDGSAVGTLCVLDYVPRDLSPRQLTALRSLAEQIARELRLRRELDRIRTSGADIPATPLGVGDAVGGWKIVGRLGQGGSGAIFDARDATGARAAIKVLLPVWAAQDAVVERFAREARVLMRIQHPHVARLLDVGNLGPERGALPYLVLERLDGEDLERHVVERGPVPAAQAASWVADACEGVAAAHALGVVHRDLKPSNVFLATEGGKPPVVKVLDFGVAKGDLRRGDAVELTRADMVMGSPRYMAPEQMLSARDADVGSDVWSMGVLLYRIVAGRVPFDGKSEMEVFASVLSRDPVPLRDIADVPPALDAIARKCLARNADERFGSMRDLAAALRAAC